MSVAVSYQIISGDITRSLTVTANQPAVRLESEYYLDQVSSIRSLDEFIADSRLFRFAMNAFGLGELAFAKGYMRKILEEGVDDPRSLANRTNDPRIAEFAQVFDFRSFGEATMDRTATRGDVVSRYVRQTLEETAGAQDGEGVRLALYFERKAPKIDSVYDVLGDRALYEVVRNVLGLPSEFAAVDIERQAEVLSERLDLADFRDPAALRGFLVRFTAMWDANEAPQSDPVLALFNSANQGLPAISLDLALSLQSIRLGGA